MQNNLILSTLFLSFFVQLIFFSYASLFKTDKVTDLSYGFTFIILAACALLKNGTFFSYQLLVSLMIFIWGVRLSGYLFIRIIKIKRDKRFDGIRENFLKFSKFWFFQAIAVWVISLPSTYLNNFKTDSPINLLMIIGSIIWLIGITTETIADMQKFKFKNDPKNKGRWIQSGIWKYSRHPNYFGEMLCWWGIFIFTVPFLSGIYWLTVTVPIFITFILLFVTGVPTLEKKYDERYKDNKEYQKYKSTTNLIIPGIKF